MIDDIKALLHRHGMINVAIVDDAYDEQPQPGDVEEMRWDRFFDDIREPDEEVLRTAYGAEDYDNRDPTELRRDAKFVAVVWQLKTRLAPASELFEEFERVLALRRVDLSPLQNLLQTTLGLTCQLIGREYRAAIADASIVFLDLFLGHHEAPSAIKLAIDRIKDVVIKRIASPPLVVLMSASPNLEELGPTFRDEAELLGCQFRMVRKVDLSDTQGMLERLFDLLTTYPDSLRLNTFLLAWQAALEKAKTTFLRTIRTLDLADYANMQALILDAEDEPVGDYVVDLYDLHLHNVLEGDESLIRSAKALNTIDWNSYPPAQFMPSEEAVEIMDGAIFHNEVRTNVEAEIEADPKAVRLGDVFLAPVQPVSAPEAATGVQTQSEAKQDISAGEKGRYAFVVLSQACDLQHSDADRILLLRGIARPYSWKHYENAKPPRTPVMRTGEELFAVEWDVLAPETWLLNDLPDRLAKAKYKRVRRFRTPFVLQLQQSFIGRLGRVGTLTALPGRHPASVKVFVRNVRDQAQLLTQASLDSGDAVCLVGRTEKGKLKEWLLLSEKFRREIRAAIWAIPSEELARQVVTVKENLSFYNLFKRGLLFARDKERGSKPFKDSNFDLVQVFARPVLVAGGDMDRSLNPIVIEIAIE